MSDVIAEQEEIKENVRNVKLLVQETKIETRLQADVSQNFCLIVFLLHLSIPVIKISYQFHICKLFQPGSKFE